MSAPTPPLPAATPSREEEAHAEVGRTAVTPRVATALTIAFVAATALVPLVEVTRLAAAGGPDRGAWRHLAGLPAGIGETIRAEGGNASAWHRVIRINRRVLAALSDFEDALDDESIIGRALRRPAQAVLSGALGAGNERVYPGTDGWLFYRPDVDYLTGRGFLDPAQLTRRSRSAAEWARVPEPDPRPAILQLATDLARAGITLVVMPTPVKPAVHPERLSGRFGRETDILHNRSYDPFVAKLRAAGVLVFDPSDALTRTTDAEPQYLTTDTHWRPEGMEAVAEMLAAFVLRHVPLGAAADPGFRIERQEVRNAGDTARMLDLPPGRPLYPPETVWLRRVLMADGAIWRSVRGADVLLLGDSFTNIYSLDSMGWGTSAGLAEQLSLALGRPVDRIVQNDEGAFATRAALQREPARLHGARVVIYQFAARELAFGDWRTLPIR